jgi:inorganic triphosphatase YgiF
MSTGTEIELKLGIPKSATARLKQHPLLVAAGTPVSMRMRAVYFDTPELDLRDARAVLRVRRSGRIWTQTFKHGGSVSAGLHARNETEHRVTGLHLDLDSLREVPGAEILGRKRVAGRLIQVFETVFTRIAWQVVAEGGARIEVALDQGDIWSTGRKLPISEVELELLEGNPASLFQLALTLQLTLPLLPENLSKAERGYRLFGNETPAPHKAATAKLQPAMRPAQALQAIVAASLSTIQANAEGAIAGADPEYIHQTRVALRRLRAALAMFARPAAGETAGAAKRETAVELRMLAGELGSARNWDVFIGQTMQPLCAAFPTQAELSALMKDAEAQRAAAYRRMHALLTSPRFARLLLRLAADVFAMTAPANEADGALRALARAALAKQHKRVMRDAEALLSADDATRHRVRIDAKKLRYAAEFFAPLFDDDDAHTYVKSLAALQDLLGGMNDVVTALGLLDVLAPNATAGLMVESWLAARHHELMQALPAAMSRIARIDKFWKRG